MLLLRGNKTGLMYRVEIVRNNTSPKFFFPSLAALLTGWSRFLRHEERLRAFGRHHRVRGHLKIQRVGPRPGLPSRAAQNNQCQSEPNLWGWSMVLYLSKSDSSFALTAGLPRSKPNNVV
jgi:hypothetical protein